MSKLRIYNRRLKAAHLNANCSLLFIMFMITIQAFCEEKNRRGQSSQLDLHFTITDEVSETKGFKL